jgi:hypothetical protein|nr:MAG TPA: hypothetical protein [Caudoviricetes sp.]
MDEYKKAVVARLRELEDEFRENGASYSRAEIARKIFDQLFYILDDAGFDAECSSGNILGRLAELIEDNGNADEVYSTEVVVTNMAEASSSTRLVFPGGRSVASWPAPERTFDFHDESDHVTLFVTTNPNDMPVEFRKKYRLTISEVPDEPDND